MTDEEREKVETLTVDAINGWARKLFCGPVMLELVNGQTDLVYLAMPSLKEEDRPAVRRIVREKVKAELMNLFNDLSK